MRSAVKQVKSSYLGLIEIAKDKDNQEIVNKIYELIPDLDSTDLQTLNKTLKNILSLVKLLDIKEKEKDFGTPKVPQEIYAEIKADIEELNRCFKNECYRSSVILCGRLLETALHRKYFEVTKNDLLEKSPGIGLGNLVAKLVEKRGIIGTVTDSSDTQITVTDIAGNIRFVDVDELTKFYSSDSKTFGISDIKNGMTIGVLGLYNKQSRRILAREVND